MGVRGRGLREFREASPVPSRENCVAPVSRQPRCPEQSSSYLCFVWYRISWHPIKPSPLPFTEAQYSSMSSSSAVRMFVRLFLLSFHLHPSFLLDFRLIFVPRANILTLLVISCSFTAAGHNLKGVNKNGLSDPMVELYLGTAPTIGIKSDVRYKTVDPTVR